VGGNHTIGWESYIPLSNNSLVHINQFKGVLFHEKMLRENSMSYGLHYMHLNFLDTNAICPE
jgi:hypothetical protein